MYNNVLDIYNSPFSIISVSNKSAYEIMKRKTFAPKIIAQR